MKQNNTVFIDNTAHYSFQNNRGIPRVRRQFISNLAAASHSTKINASLLVFIFGRYWQVTPLMKHQLPLVITSLFKLGDFLYYFSIKDRRDNKSTPQKQSVTYKNSFFNHFFTFLEKSLVAAIFIFDFITLKVKWVHLKDEIIIIPDSFEAANKQKHLIQLKQQGVTIIPIIHDILPIAYAQFFTPEHATEYKKTLNRNLKIASGFITVSKAIQEEVKHYFKTQNIDTYYPIEFSYLGSDITPKNRINLNKIRQKFLKFQDNLNVFLIVGALDPRKGHITTINAFNSLWDEGSENQLIIIGPELDTSVEILNVYNNNAYKNQYLHYFSDIDDNELAFFYQIAKALIFPSEAEGFGLPLVEAMENKLPIIASDIKVFREIAQNWPLYFQPTDIEDLSRIVRNFERVDWASKECPQWINWQQSTESLLHKAIAIKAENH